jgi:RNA polymerase sigma-70 factor (ECF subfamily)
MYRIARNARLQDLGRNRPAVGNPEANGNGGTVRPSGFDAPPQRELEHGQNVALLEQAMLELPEDKREVLVLARYQELRYEEIAALLEIETGAVKVRVHRALKDLRAKFLKLSGVKTPCAVKK